MIKLSTCYSFPSEEVSCIEVGLDPTADYPFALRVHLKSGRTLRVSYQTKGARDEAQMDLEAAIELELSRHASLSATRVQQHELATRWLTERVETFDKRQRSMWKALRKAIKGLPEEADDAK